MNNPPSDDERKTLGCGPVVPIAVLVFILAIVGYVLSIGPAQYLVDHDMVNSRPLEYFYMPLGWLAKICGPFEQAVRYYMELWTK